METPPPLRPPEALRTSTALIVGLLFGIVSVAGAASVYADPDLIPRPVAFILMALGFLTSLMGCVFAYIGLTAHRDQKGAGFFTLTVNAIALAFIVYGGIHLISERVGDLRNTVGRLSAAEEGLTSQEIVKVAGRSIPQNPDTLTLAKVEPIYLAWAEEKMVQGYEKHGRKNPDWDEAAREVIGKTMHLWITATGWPLEPAFEEKVRSLADCEDPLVAYICGRFLRESDPDLAYDLLSLAVEEMPKSGYSPGLLFLARLEFWDLLISDHSTTQEAEDLMPACLEALRLALAERPLTDDDHFIWQYFLDQGTTDTFFEVYGSRVCAIIDQAPGVQAWFKHRFRGKLEVKLAWKARGKGWSDSVSRQGWKGFAERLKEARKELTKSWELNPKHPAAAGDMITVVMGEDGDAEELRLWFDRAVTARIDYHGAYRNVLWALRPRWGGSPEAMIAFGKACAETKRFDTAVPWKLLTAARDIASEWDEPSAYFKERAPRAELMAVCRGYAREGRDADDRAYGLAQGAVLAEKFGEYADARQFLQEANFQLLFKAAAEWNLDADTWAARVAALGGPVAKPLADAERTYREGDFEAATAQLTEALKTPNLQPVDRAYLERRLNGWKDARALEAAPWTAILLPAGGSDEWTKAGWEIGGHWKQVTPEMLELEGTSRDSFLYHPKFAGSAIEIRGEIEFVSHENEEVEATLFYGSDLSRTDRFLTVRLREQVGERDTVTLSLGDGASKFAIRTDIPKRVPFSVRIVDGRVRVALSGRTVLDQPQPNIGPASLAKQNCLGIGAYGDNAPFVLRYHKLEIRGLQAPAALSVESAASNQ